ncbi:MAG: DegT/DnrJ/EryC1/StrS family aminotransferase [Woeseiaceae bacterium]|nr:DegT/DnrJ/EryC1/StrS family aminotransferase [Woeseiaceae bacterium]
MSVARTSFYFQPPVGNLSYAALTAGRGRRDPEIASRTGRELEFFSSGTMALAAAVQIAVERRPTDSPRVVVPAYSCPDLVAAVRFAGAEPEFADMRADSTNMLAAAVDEAFERAGEEAVAVIGVDLFGLPEDWPALAEIAKRRNALLIQDCAQSVQAPEAYPGELAGDAVIFSFGRGKPVCCLTGGALLTRPGIGRESDGYPQGGGSTLPLRLKNTAYNVLVRPRPYALLAMLMGDRLGATRYVPLERIEAPDAGVAALLEHAVADYWAQHRDTTIAVFEALDKLVSGADKLRWPAPLNAAACVRRLSRLPLLVDSAEGRDRLQAALVAAGISATTMYGRSLPTIVAEYDGVANTLYTPNAARFAAHLLTVPVHDRLRPTDIERMRVAIADWAGSGGAP